MFARDEANRLTGFRLIHCITFFLVFASALSSEPEFRYLQSEDGLASGEINSIIQDQDGIIWLATPAGLISYNGYDYTNYRPEPGNTQSLPDKSITNLFIDSKKNLWIIAGKYLVRYIKSGNSFQLYHFEAKQETSINLISIAQSGDYLVVLSDKGLFYIALKDIDAPKHPLRKIQVPDSEYPVAPGYSDICSFGRDMYIIHNRPESAIVSKASLQLQDQGQDMILETENLMEITNNSINAIEYAGPHAALFIGTKKGLYSYYVNENRITRIPGITDKDILSLRYTSNNRLFLSTWGPELLFIDLHTGNIGNYSYDPYKPGTLLKSHINCLYEDFSGNLWAGHREQGISILNLYTKNFRTFRHDPLNNSSIAADNVTAIGGDENFIFIGLRYGGLQYTKKNTDINEFRPIMLNRNGVFVEFRGTVWDIEKISGSKFIAGTDIGLLSLYRKEGEWILEKFSDDPLLNQSIRKVKADKNNNIWCSVTNEGLVLIPDPGKNPKENYYLYRSDILNEESLTDNTITAITVDSNDRLWIGTINGLNLLKTSYGNINLSGNSRPELRFNRFMSETEFPGMLNNNEINFIYENHDGNIWVGTGGGGLNIWDPRSGLFSYITTVQGLPDNDVAGIITDERGILWISTSNGLVAFNQHSVNPVLYYYTKDDGLQGNRFNTNSLHRSLDGELFFGGDRGFTRFYPQYIRPSNIEPMLVFTDLMFGGESAGIGELVLDRRILDRHIDMTEKIVLPYRHKTFNIEVAVLHFQNPRGNYIRYKLRGYDKEWKIIPAYYRNIYYANLPPGDYTLQVQAINSNNVSAEEIKTLSIKVLKPWHLMWYTILGAILLMLVTIGVIIYAIYYRQRLLYERKIDKLAVKNAESKMMMLTNISHGIKTPLSLVIGPIDDIIQNSGEIKPELEKQLSLIRRNADYLSKIVNQLINIRRVPAGELTLFKQNTDIVKLMRDVVLNFHSYENSKQIKINLSIPNDRLYLKIDPHKIEEVFYNILSNAFNHTPINHNISIAFDILKNHWVNKNTEKQLKITIFNEGTPIDEKYKEKIFERFFKIKEYDEGTGIGLSFSKSLVEMHEGRIEVESIPEEGTAFHIILPYTGLDNDNTEETAVITNHKEISNNDILANIEFDDIEDKLKVVIVEDNDELRSFLKKVLSVTYECFDAANGVEGLRMVKKIMPDIVISDIIMPEKDGYELCRNIKDNTKTCHIPVILLSAKNTKEQIISGYSAGADAYVTKPFDINIIESQITELIKNRELIRKKYHDNNFIAPSNGQVLSKDDEFLQRFIDILKKNISDPEFNVTTMAETLNISPTQLYRKTKALTGYSSVELIKVVKLQKAYNLLLQRNNSVKEICYLSGFNNISYFIKCFKSQYGITPAQLKDNGSTEIIQNIQ